MSNFDYINHIQAKDDIFLQKGIIYFCGNTDEGNINKTISDLLYIDNSLEKNKKIIIYINSNGGSVFHGNALIALMEDIKARRIIETICIGASMSMGTSILISGTKGYRKAHHLSFIMYHQHFQSIPYGDASYIEIWGKFSQKLKKSYLKYEETRTKIDSAKLEEIGDRDFYMNPTEAKELGFIDEIIIADKELTPPKIDKRKKYTYEEWQNINE